MSTAKLTTTILLLTVLLSSTELAAQLIKDNEVVAVVNRTVITSYDVYESLKKKEVNLEAMPKSEQEIEFNRRLVTMVRDALRAEAAKKSGVAVSPEDLENRKIKQIEKMGGEQAFESFLRGKGQSMRQFDDEFQRDQEQAAWLRVVSGRGGSKLSRELRPLYNITVRPSEIRAIYKKLLKTEFTTKNEARIRVIQVYFNKRKRGDRRAKKRLLLSLKQKLKTKADFAVLAKRHSAHGTQKEGGLLPSVEKGKGALIPEAIEKAIFADKTIAGAILGPIENINSYWLIKVEDKRAARVIPFEEAQDKIKAFRLRQKVGRAIAEVELDLLKKAYIYPPALKRNITRALEQH